MTPIENYHGDANEDLKVAKKNNNKEKFVPKDELELMVDTETLEPYRELFGKDAQSIDEEYNPFHEPVIETEKEYRVRNEDMVDAIIDRAIDKEDVDYVGDPDDAAKLETEHKELMKKYVNYGAKEDSEKEVHSPSALAEVYEDTDTGGKRQSMGARYKGVVDNKMEAPGTLRARIKNWFKF